jgi:hypothetical protein
MYDIEDMELTRREATVILSFYGVGAVIFVLSAISEMLGL